MFSWLQSAYNGSSNNVVEKEPKYGNCFPDPSDVIDAAAIGCGTGALGGAKGGFWGAVSGCAAGAAIGGAVQMRSDAKKSQDCMDKQDRKEAEEKKAPKPEPKPEPKKSEPEPKPYYRATPRKKR